MTRLQFGKFLFFCSCLGLLHVRATVNDYHNAYKDDLKNNANVWMKREGNKGVIEQITIDREIAVGGSKVAIQLINKNEVLMVPKNGRSFNYTDESTQEIEMSKRLVSVGLHNASPEKVSLYRDKGCSKESLIGNFYIAPSFASLQENDPKTYVFDVRHRNISGKPGQYWDLQNQSLLTADQQAKKYDLDTWLPIIRPLLNDIKVIVDHDLHLSMDNDTLNLAFVREKTIAGGYKVQFFGFDFCDKQKRFFDIGFAPKLSEEEKDYIKNQYLDEEAQKVGMSWVASSKQVQYQDHLLKKKCINHLIERLLSACFWVQKYHDEQQNTETYEYPEPGHYHEKIGQYYALIEEAQKKYYDIINPPSDRQSPPQSTEDTTPSDTSKQTGDTRQNTLTMTNLKQQNNLISNDSSAQRGKYVLFFLSIAALIGWLLLHQKKSNKITNHPEPHTVERRQQAVIA